MKKKLLFVAKVFLFFLLFLSFFIQDSQNWVLIQQEEADLNGDGKKEVIKLYVVGEPDCFGQGDFRLQIDKQEYKGSMIDCVDGFSIEDINPEDKYKEIFIHTPGPSSDDEYLVLYYDGLKIKKAGLIFRWIRYIGKGTVIIDDWAGFWSATQKYILDSKHKLRLVPQKIYHVNVKVNPVRDFTIYDDPSSQRPVETIKAGESITILAFKNMAGLESASEEKAWYLILSEHKILGWAQLKSFRDILPWAD